mmetsp:Transcript_12166/g.28668  ORF Transcript_12166/g.28668 Transcript_12166/m.28668 type:complete len:264 (-) Transcript_12166:26-817(-)
MHVRAALRVRGTCPCHISDLLDLPPSAAPPASALVLAAAASATASATASALALLATATLLLLRLLLAGGKTDNHLHSLGHAETSTRHGFDGSVEGTFGGRLGNSALIPTTLLLLLLLLLLACLGLGLHVGLPAVAVVRDAAGSAGPGGTAGLVGRLLLSLLPVRLLLHLHRRGLGRGGDAPARRRRRRPLGLALPDGLISRTRLLGPGGTLGTCALLLGGGGSLLTSVLDQVIERLVHICFRGRCGRRGRRSDGKLDCGGRHG